ncbi:MAG: porin family protein [Deltaproteobacteria bacterium]|nr:porin family protein [Deltaproteobacteria bacterium]MBW2385818.1 porin family protein [Deltaproteobacteria bacterium]
MARPWILIIALLVCLAVPVAAQEESEEEPDYARSGPYVGGTFNIGLVSSKAFPGTSPISWEPYPGIDARLGWRESERFALEIEFEWLASTDGIAYGSWAIGVNGKFYFAEERIQPYMVLGANGMWAKVPGAADSDVDWAFRNGIGLDYYLTENWAINGETSFVWGVGEIWKYYYLTFGVGAIYRF